MGRQHDGSRALRIAGVAFSLVAVMLAALPVAAARYAITHHLSITSCFIEDSASWTSIPANARTYAILVFSNGANPYTQVSGSMTSRSGSDGFAGNLVGTGSISTRIVFYDSLLRPVYSADDSEGSIAVSC